MKLEMVTFPVNEVKFKAETSYRDGILYINRDELIQLILEDPLISFADIDIAMPGEKTRIVNVRDVVEPRIKISGPGNVFPGVIGPPDTVGDGRDHRLSSITVIITAKYKPTVKSGTGAGNTSILDMWGNASALSPFSSTHNIVLSLDIADSVSELQAHSIIQSAEYRVANRIAETTRNETSSEVECFELDKCDKNLPKIVYIAGFVTHWHAPHTYVAYYGLPVRESLPTIIHPNEFLDGALTPDARKGNAGYTTTWSWMNHPTVLTLLREHNKSLNFIGVILQRTRFESERGKQVLASCTSQMAKLLGADGAILTRTTSSGANFEDVMLTLKACEQKGIPTVLLNPEWGGAHGTEIPLVFYLPEANAMVSSGSHDRELTLETPQKVIGIKEGELAEPLFMGDPPFSPWGEMSITTQDLTGGIDWWGGMNTTCQQF